MSTLGNLTTTAFCLFCDKPKEQNDSDNAVLSSPPSGCEESIVKDFFRLADRFMSPKRFGGNGRDDNIRCTDSLKSLFAVVGEDSRRRSILWACTECEQVLQAYCDAIYRMKSAQLEAEWKLWELGQIVSKTTKRNVKNRPTMSTGGFPRHDEKVVEDAVVTDLRRSVTQKCSWKRDHGTPRVLLDDFAVKLTNINLIDQDVFQGGQYDNTPSTGPQSLLLNQSAIDKHCVQQQQWQQEEKLRANEEDKQSVNHNQEGGGAQDATARISHLKSKRLSNIRFLYAFLDPYRSRLLRKYFNMEWQRGRVTKQEEGFAAAIMGVIRSCKCTICEKQFHSRSLCVNHIMQQHPKRLGAKLRKIPGLRGARRSRSLPSPPPAPFELNNEAMNELEVREMMELDRVDAPSAKNLTRALLQPQRENNRPSVVDLTIKTNSGITQTVTVPQKTTAAKSRSSETPLKTKGKDAVVPEVTSSTTEASFEISTVFVKTGGVLDPDFGPNRDDDARVDEPIDLEEEDLPNDVSENLF